MLDGLQAVSANMLAPPDGDIADLSGLIATLKAMCTPRMITPRASTVRPM